MGVELFHADTQTYMTKLIVAFRNYANAPKTFWLSEPISKCSEHKIRNSTCPLSFLTCSDLAFSEVDFSKTGFHKNSKKKT